MNGVYLANGCFEYFSNGGENREARVNYKVLITTSGIGSRLGELTKYTNKALARVGDKPVISHIVEKYPSDTKFVITLGHFGNHVKEYLSAAHPERFFEFVQVENYSGPGSSLANSILQAKPLLDSPFIFHASDTLFIGDVVIPEPKTNWVGGALSNDASDYSSFDVNDQFISKFHPKGMIDFDYVHIGLIGIKDHQEFWDSLTKVLKDSSDSSLGDVDVLILMKNSGLKLGFINFEYWFDTGSAGKLEIARSACTQQFEVLDKANESVFFVNNNVIKFFGDEDICKNRVTRSELLSGLVPKVSHSTAHFYRYSFQAGTEMSQQVSSRAVDELLTWASKFLWKTQEEVSRVDFYVSCQEFYQEKTVRRLNEFLEKNELSDQEIIINEELVPSATQLLNQIDFQHLSTGFPTGFHGDFILDNILRTEFGFTLLDWRQDFAGELSVGDMYYDLAKLNHSFFVNHEIVQSGKYVLKVENKKVTCDIYRKQSQIDGQDTLFEYLNINGLDTQKVRILTSLIWINMAPLHHHPFDQFLYFFGRYTLAKALASEK
jgi:choline kinase